MRCRFREEERRHHGQDHPGRLERLLDRDLHRLCRRHRTRRVHRPPVEVPRVREERPARRPDALHPEGQGRHQDLRQRAARRLGPRRQAVRSAQGLGHDRLHRQHGARQEGRRHAGRAAEHELEPEGRWQLRSDHQEADHRRQGQERHRRRLRQKERRRLRLPESWIRRHDRPDRVEPLRGEQRLQVPGQALGHQVLLRRPQARRNHRLARRSAGQGPVGFAGKHARPGAGRDVRRRQGGDGAAGLVDDFLLRQQREVRERLDSAAQGPERQARHDVQRPG